MIKPPGIPGVGSMTDTFDFVKNLWGMMGVPGMNAPGMVVPTVSVEELDKKIGDLKAVESWLSVNMSMLRGTIQALEVQRATIATLQSMGESFSEAVNKAKVRTNEAASEPTAFPFPEFSSTQASKPSQKTHIKETPQPEPSIPKPTQAESDQASQMANPAAWWSILQDQFKQAVNTAMVPESSAKSKPVSPAPKAAKVTTKKVASRKTAKPRAKTTKPTPSTA